MAIDIAWYQSLPRKRSAAAVILRNHADDILLVKPSYKDNWQLAGGVVDDLESPRQAALREVQEELGLQLDHMRLRAIDYMPSETLGDCYQTIWDGGILSDEQIAQITLQENEISEYRFFTREQGEDLLSDAARKRLAFFWDNGNAPDMLYLEDGMPV